MTPPTAPAPAPVPRLRSRAEGRRRPCPRPRRAPWLPDPEPPVPKKSTFHTAPTHQPVKTPRFCQNSPRTPTFHANHARMPQSACEKSNFSSPPNEKSPFSSPSPPTLARPQPQRPDRTSTILVRASHASAHSHATPLALHAKRFQSPTSVQNGVVFGRQAPQTHRPLSVSPGQPKSAVRLPCPNDRKLPRFAQNHYPQPPASSASKPEGEKFSKIVLAQRWGHAYNGRAAKARGVSSVG